MRESHESASYGISAKVGLRSPLMRTGISLRAVTVTVTSNVPTLLLSPCWSSARTWITYSLSPPMSSGRSKSGLAVISPVTGWVTGAMSKESTPVDALMLKCAASSPATDQLTMSSSSSYAVNVATS